MVICSKKDVSLLNVIDNNYIRTKEELDNYIHETKTMVTVYVDNSFIEEEFINKGLSFPDYVKTIEFVNNLISFDTKFNVSSEVEDLTKMLNEINTSRDLALYALNHNTFISKLKFALNELNNLKLEIDKLNSNLMFSRKELDITKQAIREIDTENNNLNSQIIISNSKLRQIKEVNRKLNIDRYEYVIYLKENESVRHTYSLVSSIRNKLSIQGVTTSVMVVVPKSSDLVFEKWKQRDFTDLRTPYISDLVDSRKVIVDYSILDKMEIFLRNTIQSQVLIVLDKSLSSSFMFTAKNIFLVDIGRFKIKNFEHFGSIKQLDKVNMTVQELMDYYCENPAIKAIIMEVCDDKTSERYT